MKKYNINTIEEFKLNAVGADASVHLRKNQNRNNIKIFDEHKLNVVGVGVPDDPNSRHKHTNKLMSNIPTSNAAITLIALIITIIVLLILAGVTLNMVMGENGIFGKANNAKNKTEIAQYEEELRLCVLEMQTEEAANGKTFNMDTIRDNLDIYTQKLYDETIEWKEKDIEEPTGIYKGYNFYIDKKYGAHITGKATGIQISMKILSEIPETGYTNQDVNLKITITNNEKGLKQVTKPDGNTENLNGAKTYEEEKTATENTKYTYVVTDTEGKEETKEIELNIIDKLNPIKCNVANTEITDEGLKINVEAEDAEATNENAKSGINKEKYEYWIKKSTESEATKHTENPIKLNNGIYSVYVVAYDNAGNSITSSETNNIIVAEVYKDITPKMVAQNPELYYGMTVTNYESQNGQNDWKIFYSDWEEKKEQQNTENPTDTHIFLITGDNVDFSKENRLSDNVGMITDGKTVAAWGTAPSSLQEVKASTIDLFKATKYTLNGGIVNSRCAATLLNDDNWTMYKDNNGKANSAIGGVTTELWEASWNSRYPNQKISFGNPNDVGYYSVDIASSMEGSNNKLYFPYTDYSGGSNGAGYWFASPGYYGVNFMQFANYQFYYGATYVGSTYYYWGRCIRPVVALNANVTVNAMNLE